MIEPRIRIGSFGLVIIFYLLFVFPLSANAQENLTTSAIAPIPTITLNTTALNQIVPIKNLELSNSSSLSLNGTQHGSLSENKHYFITDSRTGQKYVKDRVIVRFKSQKNTVSSISDEKIRAAHAKVGAQIEKDLSIRSVSGLQIVQLPNGTDVQSAIKVYESNPDILYAEPDYVFSIIPDQNGPIIHDTKSLKILSIPNDAFFSNQWSFQNTGQTGGTPGADIDAPEAWNLSTGSNSVVVAVIDTGVLYNHSDLSSNIWNNIGEIPGNGIDDDSNGYIDDIHGWNFINNTSDPIDDNGHGTHVSGTIGAVGNNTIGVAGVNWHVKIMPLKAFNLAGVGYTSEAIKAIEYANANGASVISNSWGGPDYSQALNDVINASPAIVVCAAGNGASDNGITPVYPASYNSTNIISVAASNENDNLSSLSNFGLNSVDLAAPGTNIYSTYLGGNYAYMSGSSMATPHVSGVAALVKAVNPSLTSVQIKNIILSTVNLKSSLSGKVASGGRLNAYKAVLAANPPVADFIGNPRNGTAPMTVDFTDLSVNTSITWNWTFGDGNITNTTLKNPVHTYWSAGIYSVSLNSTNFVGNNTTTKANYITVMSEPVANFTAIPTSGTAPLTVQFNDTSTNTPTAWNWSFTNVTGNNTQVVFSTIQNPTQTFGVGNYSIALNASNKIGYNLSTQVTFINVTAAIIVPVANFTVNNNAGIYRLSVTFTDTSIGTGITAWNWSFGDGTWDNKTSSSNPIHEYGVGTWYPTLSVTNSAGNNTTPFTPVRTITVTPPPTLASNKIGVYEDGAWYLDWNGNGVWDGSDKAYSFGAPGWTPIVGDWNATGKSNIGVTNGQAWYLDWNGNGIWDGADKVYSFGAPGWLNVTGDWNHDGKTEIGVTNGQQWYLDNNGNGAWDNGIDSAYNFGAPGWTPIVGDWNATGFAYIGVTNGQQWYLDWNGNGAWDAGDKVYNFGAPGWTPIVGDWDSTGKSYIGVTNGQQWYLDWNGNGAWDGVDRAYNFGAPGWTPVLGDWSGDGKTKIGVTNSQQWYLDANGNGIWDIMGIDYAYSFGAPGWTPIVGKWS